MSNSLQERLKTHSNAFDGLLSLIPAKYYYDDATLDQWQQKKKSKKEQKENKKAKFDPDSKNNADEYFNSHTSAKDVMTNKGLTAKKVRLPGRRPERDDHQNENEDDQDENEDDQDENEDDQNESEDNENGNDENEDVESEQNEENDHDEEKHDNDNDKEEQLKGKKLSINQKLSTDKQTPTEPAILLSLLGSMDLDDETEAGTFAKADAQKKKLSPEEQKKKDENLARLREKLSAKISMLKDKRKAPGSKSGGAVKSREQMLAERKRKEELKKERKKRTREEMEEESGSESDDEEISEVKTDTSKPDDESVVYGNIVFQDGSRVTSDLSRMRNTAEKKKQKGPAQNDLKAHLQKIEAKKRKLEGLSEEDRAKQSEKDKWNRMMAAAEGIKVKDDEKLLKKALKRKERQKLRSEIEWKERKQVVKDTVAARAKRREENLKARKENKGKKSKHQTRLKKFTGTINKSAKKRAGFEGSAKSKKRGGKK